MRLAVTVDETLLALKVAFLVLLYLFVWLVVRSATKGLTEGSPQESSSTWSLGHLKRSCRRQLTTCGT